MPAVSGACLRAVLADPVIAALRADARRAVHELAAHPHPARRLAHDDRLAAAGTDLRRDRQRATLPPALGHRATGQPAASSRSGVSSASSARAWTSSLRAGALDDGTGTSAVFVLAHSPPENDSPPLANSPRVNRARSWLT